MKKIFTIFTASIFIALLFLFILFLFSGKKNILNKLETELNNRFYLDEIKSASEKTGVDKILLTAMVYTESRFRPDAVSQPGALGLMQLMPSTAFYVAKKNKISLKDTDELFNPEVNILLGALYFKELQENFNDTKLAIAAYNGGPASVRKWLKGSVVSDSIAEGLDKAETKRYVEEVVRIEERMRRAYQIWRWINE